MSLPVPASSVSIQASCGRRLESAVCSLVAAMKIALCALDRCIAARYQGLYKAEGIIPCDSDLDLNTTTAGKLVALQRVKARVTSESAGAADHKFITHRRRYSTAIFQTTTVKGCRAVVGNITRHELAAAVGRQFAGRVRTLVITDSVAGMDRRKSKNGSVASIMINLKVRRPI